MSRIDKLEKHKGFPVPFIVYRDKENVPHFKINDERKVNKCIAENLCSICGENLNSGMWLIGGPISAFHPKGAYADIPIHKECGIFALQNCPYMAYTKYMAKTPLGLLDSKLDDLMLYNPTQDNNRLLYFVFVKIKSYNVVVRNIYERFIHPEKPYLDVEFWKDGLQITAEKAQLIQRYS